MTPQDIKQNQQRERQMEQRQEETRSKLPGDSPWALLQGELNPSSSGPQPEKLQNPVPKVFTGAGHIDTLCLAHTKIPDFQKESRSSDSWSTEDHSLRFWEWWEVSQNPSFQTSTWQWAFLRMAGPVLLCWHFLHSHKDANSSLINL